MPYKKKENKKGKGEKIMASYETKLIKKYMKDHPKSKSPLIKNINKILKKKKVK